MPQHARAKVIDRDHGWKELMRRASMSGHGPFRARVVKVGVQGAEASQLVDERGHITMVMLAAVHEFGRLDGTIPARSFIRACVDEHRQEYRALIRKLAAAVLVGKVPEKKALAIIGEKVVNDIKARMERGLSPPLAESTVEDRLRDWRGPKAPKHFKTAEAADAYQKKYAAARAKAAAGLKPLIRSGTLKNSITYVVEA